jgi:hypothetical protein
MCGVGFGHDAMAIDFIVFGLTTMGIHGGFVCRTTLAIGLVLFHRAATAIRGVVLCHATTALLGVVARRADTATCGVVFCCAAMAIGGVDFGLRCVSFLVDHFSWYESQLFFQKIARYST